MKRVHYAETVFLTDGRVADALMAYARTLSLVSAADVVQVPGVDEDGKVRAYELLIGPASQIIAHDVDDEPVEMDAEDAVRDLAERQVRRLPPADAVIYAALPEDHPEATPLNTKDTPQ